ncbi:4-hydroxy-3-methylbut-2-enyl diphosphate reductase [Anaeromicropila populeti]|uniref:4-hydroxy-3-methylbut-2-enyl diphosphate reductase n=1 Tax=Anaeromicropila populeti TaxID=37658 RepID=A0A1I6KG55_9FIRM|nr:4-hydroxy-3-methylbut-2-enyl diphosphate reductase [Anaeromicropila populeti]SFR90232.1 4-hydroxy-3-methylbut-2-enyl diphosphate reductase [Anaeromicropila populeti]
MNVKVAENAGFCFGVERAVDMVYKEAMRGDNVYTFGSIIHNEQVVRELEQQNVKVVNNLEELRRMPKGTIIIRSHGVSKAVQDAMENMGFRVVNATCPFVIKIHKIVFEKSNEGRQIIIIGNEDHPEVMGINGWCHDKAIIVKDEKDVEKISLEEGSKVCIVAQTTFNYKKFEVLVEIISKKRYDIIAFNTICNATEVRQREARELASVSDAMLVVGGKHSSNTQKLYEICKKECINTYYIQTVSDLNLDIIKSFHNVGITAGASTPNKIIKEVQIACQK